MSCLAAISVIAVVAPSRAETKAEHRSWGIGLKTTVGSGKSASDTRNVAAFERLDLQDGLVATVRRGSAQSVIVTADDNIVPLVETKVHNNTLIVRIRPNTSLRTKSPIAVAVDYTKLDQLRVQDGVRADVDTLASPSVVVKVSDGATLKLAGIDAQSVDVAVSDGATATIRSVSRTQQHKYRVSDGARLEIEATDGGRANVVVSDGARFTSRGFNASELDLKLSDGARAKLAGAVASQTYALHDGASVDARELKGSNVTARVVDASSLDVSSIDKL
ncbi:MAG: GIN domain-containing protein, partial [Casimicrobium sp.]